LAKLPTRLGVCALVLAFAAEVRGQDAAQPSGISTTEDVETIEVIGPAKKDQPEFLDTPIEVEMIPQARLQELPAHDLADVAANLPGIRLQRRVQGQGAAASVEGLPPEYTRALVNGQHYAGELGGVTDLEDLPLANASRVLVLRGPQAMRYGSEAGGAVIEIETFRPPPDDGVDFRLDAGGGGYERGYASQVTGGRYGRFGATLATTYSGVDGWNDRGSDAVVTAPGRDYREEWQDAYGTFEFQASERLLLSSNVGWRKDQDKGGGPDPGEGSLSGKRDTWRWITSVGFAASLGEDTDLESEVYRYASNLKSSIGRDFRLQDEEYRYDGALTRRFELFGQEPALRLGFDWRLPSLDLSESQVASDAPPVPPTDPSDPGDGTTLVSDSQNERFTATGVYAILTAPLHETVEVQLGAREQFHSRFDSEFVPQVALLVRPTTWLKLRGSWGTSYRTPSLRDLYEPPVPNLGGAYFLSGNPDLKPEHAEGLRGGFELEPLDELSFSATFFTNRITDYIRSAKSDPSFVVGWNWPSNDDPWCQEHPSDCGLEPTPITANLFEKTNLDDVRTSGLEANLTYDPHPLVSLHAGYFFMDTWVKSAPLPDLHELPNEPRYTVDLDATVTAPRWDTNLLVRARWRDGALTEASGTGSVSFTSQDHSDPSWVVDLRLRQPLRSGLTLYLDLNNLTNTKAVDSYEIRGFNAFVGVRYDFDSN
jgi:outer membrane receptor protein involved in Fe transport